MCLTIDPNATLKFNKHGYIICYKFFKIFNGQLLTPYQETICNVGILKSNRRMRKLLKSEASWGRVDKGIHVYISKAHAEKEVERWWSDCAKVYRVKCHKDDLVAVGLFGSRKSAVFMKVEILAD